MLLYTTCLVIFGLVHVSQGQITTVRLELSEDGTPVTDTTVDAKIGQDFTIKCVYDAWTSPKQIPGVFFKGPTDSEGTAIFISGHTSPPWSLDKDRYINSFEWDNVPYHAQLIMKNVTLDDAGEYSCQVNDAQGNNLLTPDTGTINIAANTLSVELDAAKDGKYPVVASDFKEPIICRAYNGSKPTIKIKVADEPVVTAEVTSIEDDVYEATIYQKFTGDMNGKKITCTSEVAGYENEAKVAEATLEITSKPIVKCKDNTLKARINAKTTISCMVSGNPLPMPNKIEWRVENGLTLNATGTNTGLISKADLVENQYHVVLQVTINRQSFTRYNLVAVNDAGSASDSVTISEEAATVKGPDNGASSLPNLLSSSILLFFACYALFV